MRRCTKRIAPLAILALTAGCATADSLWTNTFGGPETAAETAAVVEVENNNLEDMRIYAYRAGSRAWLGRVPSLSRRSFRLPVEWTNTLHEIRLIADAPAGPGGYQSDPFRVRGNQVVEFRIEDPITISRVSIWNGTR